MLFWLFRLPHVDRILIMITQIHDHSNHDHSGDKKSDASGPEVKVDEKKVRVN